jgi:thiamine-phosphate pyrophosphorylase
MMGKAFDPFLYLVTDRKLAGSRSLADIVREAIAGGVTLVQLREKSLPHAEFVKEAHTLTEVCHAQGIPLIVNDDVDVALEAGADGVHLGQSDASPQEARARLGSGAIIGLSVENVGQTCAAAALDIDYLAASPVFATPTKTDTAPPLGLEGVQTIRRLCDKPLVAIGGINLSNALTVLRAGADGIAVVSALMAATDPRHAAKDFANLRSQLEP